MNFNSLMNTMNDTNLTINQRTEAASRLWEASNRLNKSLKSFKSELIEMADN